MGWCYRFLLLDLDREFFPTGCILKGHYYLKGSPSSRLLRDFVGKSADRKRCAREGPAAFLCVHDLLRMCWCQKSNKHVVAF